MDNNKHKTMGSIILCLAILIILFCGGCSFASKNEEPVAQSIISDAPASTSSGSLLEENEIPFSESTIVDGFECNIEEVNWYSSRDFDYDLVDREDGYEYIVIVLAEKNTTTDTENAPMLNILSADGQQCSLMPPILSLYKNKYKINFGATMADSTAYAYFIYQIPIESQSFKLQILSNGFGTNSKYIVFNRNDIQ